MILVVWFQQIWAWVCSVIDSIGNWFYGIWDQVYRTMIASEGWKVILTGLGVTLEIAFFAIIIGTVLGCILALMKISKLRILNVIANIYTTVVRGIPVVTQLMIYMFILFGGWNEIFVAVLGFGINSGAYVCEIFRAGIQGIDRGQTEAGRSLGLSHWQTFRKIVLPQAVKVVLPTYTSEFIALIKETSVAGYIAITDLTKAGDMIRNATYDAWTPLLMVAAIYLILTLGLTKLFGVFERRLARSDRG